MGGNHLLMLATDDGKVCCKATTHPMAKQPTRFNVVYWYFKPGGGCKTRTSVSGYVWQQLGGAQTESAVIAYLRHKHMEFDVVLKSLVWS